MKSYLPYILLFHLLAGCSHIDDTGTLLPQTVPVSLSVAHTQRLTISALGDSVHQVDRILVLPFQKLDPLLSDNNNANFAPLYGFARQWDLVSFPTGNLTLSLQVSCTYKVMVLGYNRADYDLNNPNQPDNRFSIGGALTPERLENFQLYPNLPIGVPKFFTTFCTAMNNGIPLGTTFTTEKQTSINLNGTLKRIVSAISIEITDIPLFVNSITLVARQMVKAVKAVDATPTIVQFDGDGENRTIRQKIPVNGKITFGEYLLPTGDAYKTLFYLDVAYGNSTERYTIKVPDSAVSVSNNIILRPNQVVRITGSYLNINLGFQINGNINLDDNIWDGLQ